MFKTKNFLAVALVTLLSSVCPLMAWADGSKEDPLPPSTATKLFAYNASMTDVVMMIVVPANGGDIQQDGCPTDVANVKIVDNGAGDPISLRQFGANTQGWIEVKRGHKVEVVNTLIDPYTGKNNGCLQGLHLGFGQFGNSCPGTTLQTVPAFPDPRRDGAAASPPILLPNGSNSVEPSLNLPHKIRNSPGGGANEGVDISCVNGANCTLSLTVTAPAAGPLWAYNDGSGNKFFQTLTGQNSWVNIAGRCDDNCIDSATRKPRIGVFPYGCTQCNRFPDPAPPCIVNGHGQQFCAVNNGLPPNNGCLISRSPGPNQTFGGIIGGFGGDVTVTYLGPLTPPASCH